MGAKRSTVVERIRRFNAGRDDDLLMRKLATMYADPFSFLRGTCHLFYDRLPRARVLKAAPLAWACGDLHLSNFGSYRGDNHLVYFDLNDFDEACLAPCTWDMVRLLTSVLVGTKPLKLGRGTRRQLCEVLLHAYVETIQEGKARWVERETATGVVRELLDGLQTRKRKTLLDQRSELKKGTRRITLDGKHALKASSSRRKSIVRFMARFAAAQPNRKFFRLLDIARRVAGTGSLGLERYLLCVEGHGSPDGNFLLDLKEAMPSSVARHASVSQPRWPSEAHRVVALQRRVQAISMAFLRPVLLDGKPFVLRALQPTEDRVDLSSLSGEAGRLEGLMTTLGQLVAWAQLRSSGRQGSATADGLIDYWAKPRRSRKLYELARECEEQLASDWQEYRQGYEAGALTRNRER